MLLHLELATLFLTLTPLSSLAALPGGYPSQTVLSQAALSDVLLRGLPILGASLFLPLTYPILQFYVGPDSGSSKFLLCSSPRAASHPQTPSDVKNAHFYNLWMMVYACSTSASRIILVMILLGSTTVSSSPPLLLTLDLHVYEAAALLAPTTTMTYVFFGLYQWLKKHPTEAVLVSINHESGTGTPYDAKIQEMVYDIINSDIGNRYWVQTRGSVRSLLLFHFDCVVLNWKP